MPCGLCRPQRRSAVLLGRPRRLQCVRWSNAGDRREDSHRLSQAGVSQQVLSAFEMQGA